MSDPLIAVVGAGAVGGLLAAVLDRAGIEVVVVARPGTARAIEASGLTIQSRQFGDGVSRIRAVTEVPDGASVILATKAFALPALTGSLAKARPAEVVSLLNGIEHLAVLRADVPDALLAGASVAVESTRLSPTVIDHRSPFLRLTVPAHATDSGIATAWRAAGLDVTTGGSDEEVLWAKFRFLAPMALLTSYWRMPIGAAIQHDAQLTTALLTEVAQIATRDGVPTGTGQLEQALAALPPAMRSSLHNDLAAGQQSELDAIGGALTRRGRTLGVPTPSLDILMTDLAAGTSHG
jgi:2-dehydropantoate 2-reductase